MSNGILEHEYSQSLHLHYCIDLRLLGVLDVSLLILSSNALVSVSNVFLELEHAQRLYVYHCIVLSFMNAVYVLVLQNPIRRVG